ncbi:hypothetical protein [Saccharothrix syringae]|uniref:Lipoprotein n=1 Tax=Saccharothrix syringae TaxID=103733 RepID=A0A5Q0GT36_SACSY|nr:hypothetical protein [Saccharothrix syringae]QFZ16522.1 hypothetical protein EKG83_02720 [Saccharothrix syringae]
MGRIGVALLAVVLVTACAEEPAEPRWEVEPHPVSGVAAVSDTGDREFRVGVETGALAAEDPIERVDVRRGAGRVELTLWLKSRVPRPGEAVPAIVRMFSEVVVLDAPLGEDRFYDASADPPRELRVGCGLWVLCR